MKLKTQQFGVFGDSRSGLRNPAQICALKPWPLKWERGDSEETIFLAGFRGGMVCLFCTTQSHALHQWDIGDSLADVAWSLERPGVFFAVGRRGGIRAFDILQSISEPTVVGETGSDVEVTSMAISDDSVLVVALKNGTVRIRTVDQAFREALVEEAHEALALMKGTQLYV